MSSEDKASCKEIFSKTACSSKNKFTEVKSIADLEKSAFLNNSDTVSCKNPPPGNHLGDGGKKIDLAADSPEPEPEAELGGHVNHLEYIDASCFSSPNLKHSFLASCDNKLSSSISSLLRELNSPEMSQFEKQEDREKLNGCKLSRAPMEGEVRGGRDDEVSISSVLSKASPHWRKESKEAKPSSDEDARTLKTDGPDDISTGGVKLKESALEDKKIATIENLNKWGFLR